MNRVSTIYQPYIYRVCTVGGSGRTESIDDTEFTMYDLFGDWERCMILGNERWYLIKRAIVLPC